LQDCHSGRSNRTRECKVDAMKKFNHSTSFIILLLGVVLLATPACMTSQTGQVYNRNEAQSLMNIYHGTITSISPATIQSDNSGLGTVLGGVAGGVVGSTIGHGAGRTLASVGGALAGAAAGSAVEHGARTNSAWEIIIRLDDGRDIVVVQEQDQESNSFRIGDRVRVIESQNGTLHVRR